MAVADGVNTAKQAAGGMRNPNTFDGNPRVLCDKYVFPADVFSASDFIKIGTLPKGAVVLDAGINIPESLGTTGQFTLGTEADPDAFCAAADAGGQAATAKASTGAGIGVRQAAAVDVRLDCSEVTDDAADKSIFAWVKYIVLGE